MGKKLISSLAKKKFRDKLGLFVAEGLRFVSDIPDCVHIECYAVTEAFLERNSFSFRPNTPRFVYDENTFLKLSDTVSPQGILAVCKQIKHDLFPIVNDAKGGTFVIADGIKDPGNLGTIIRTAASSGARAVFLTENTVDLYNPKVLRSTMGALFNVAVIKTNSDIFATLKSAGISIVGTSPKAAALYYDVNFKSNTAFVIGSEAEGISHTVSSYCDTHVSIPVSSGCESLNAAVAAGIILYEALRQKNGGGRIG